MHIRPAVLLVVVMIFISPISIVRADTGADGINDTCTAYKKAFDAAEAVVPKKIPPPSPECTETTPEGDALGHCVVGSSLCKGETAPGLNGKQEPLKKLNLKDIQTAVYGTPLPTTNTSPNPPATNAPGTMQTPTFDNALMFDKTSVGLQSGNLQLLPPSALNFESLIQSAQPDTAQSGQGAGDTSAPTPDLRNGATQLSGGTFKDVSPSSEVQTVPINTGGTAGTNTFVPQPQGGDLMKSGASDQTNTFQPTQSQTPTSDCGWFCSSVNWAKDTASSVGAKIADGVDYVVNDVLTSPTDAKPNADMIQKAANGETISGTATEYNPFKPGESSGGKGLATGGTYDPNAYSAAIQKDIGLATGCGVGGGTICYARIDYGDKSLIVTLPDNGPLSGNGIPVNPTRIIDLNQASMDYLSGVTDSSNVSLDGVKVTLLPGSDYTPGPVSTAIPLPPVNPLTPSPYAYGPEEASSFNNLPSIYAYGPGEASAFNNLPSQYAYGPSEGEAFNNLPPEPVSPDKLAEVVAYANANSAQSPTESIPQETPLPLPASPVSKVENGEALAPAVDVGNNIPIAEPAPVVLPTQAEVQAELAAQDAKLKADENSALQARIADAPAQLPQTNTQTEMPPTSKLAWDAITLDGPAVKDDLTKIFSTQGGTLSDNTSAGAEGGSAPGSVSTMPETSSSYVSSDQTAPSPSPSTQTTPPGTPVASQPLSDAEIAARIPVPDTTQTSAPDPATDAKVRAIFVQKIADANAQVQYFQDLVARSESPAAKASAQAGLDLSNQRLDAIVSNSISYSAGNPNDQLKQAIDTMQQGQTGGQQYTLLKNGIEQEQATAQQFFANAPSSADLSTTAGWKDLGKMLWNDGAGALYSVDAGIKSGALAIGKNLDVSSYAADPTTAVSDAIDPVGSKVSDAAAASNILIPGGLMAKGLAERSLSFGVDTAVSSFGSSAIRSAGVDVAIDAGGGAASGAASGVAPSAARIIAEDSAGFPTVVEQSASRAAADLAAAPSETVAAGTRAVDATIDVSAVKTQNIADEFNAISGKTTLPAKTDTGVDAMNNLTSDINKGLANEPKAPVSPSNLPKSDTVFDTPIAPQSAVTPAAESQGFVTTAFNDAKTTASDWYSSAKGWFSEKLGLNAPEAGSSPIASDLRVPTTEPAPGAPDVTIPATKDVPATAETPANVPPAADAAAQQKIADLKQALADQQNRVAQTAPGVSTEPAPLPGETATQWNKVDQALADAKSPPPATEPAVTSPPTPAPVQPGALTSADTGSIPFNTQGFNASSPIKSLETLPTRDLTPDTIAALKDATPPEGYKYLYRGLTQDYAVSGKPQYFTSDLGGAIEYAGSKPEGSLVRITVPEEYTGFANANKMTLSNNGSVDVYTYPKEWFDPAGGQSSLDALAARNALKQQLVDNMVDGPWNPGLSTDDFATSLSEAPKSSDAAVGNIAKNPAAEVNGGAGVAPTVPGTAPAPVAAETPWYQKAYNNAYEYVFGKSETTVPAETSAQGRALTVTDQTAVDSGGPAKVAAPDTVIALPDRTLPAIRTVGSEVVPVEAPTEGVAGASPASGVQRPSSGTDFVVDSQGNAKIVNDNIVRNGEIIPPSRDLVVVPAEPASGATNPAAQNLSWLDRAKQTVQTGLTLGSAWLFGGSPDSNPAPTPQNPGGGGGAGGGSDTSNVNTLSGPYKPLTLTDVQKDIGFTPSEAPPAAGVVTPTPAPAQEPLTQTPEGKPVEVKTPDAQTPPAAPVVPRTVPTYVATPVVVANPTDPMAGRVFDQDYYCIKSITPVVVTQVPAGTPMPTGCYNNGSTQPQSNGLNNILGPLAARLMTTMGLTPSAAAPVQQNSQTQTPVTSPATTASPGLVVSLIANPNTVTSGGKAMLAWSSVGTSACGVFMPDGSQIGAGSPDGSTSTPALATTTAFTANCSAPSGATATATTTVQVK